MSLGRCSAGPLPLGVAILVALAAPACRRAPPTPHLAGVRVSSSGLQDLLGEGARTAEAIAAASRALEAAGFSSAPGQPSYRARVELLSVRAVPRAAGPGLEVEVVAEVELAPVEEGGVARRELGAARVRGEATPQALTEALGAAVGEAGRALKLGLTSDAKPTEALLKDLDAADPRLRDHAVQALGERRERRAVPGLLRRLRDGDERLVDRAVGALVQIGDPSAVPALIDLSRSDDPDTVRRLVPAVADIGGPDARGWLLTLRQAHPDASVRRLAAEALDELEARGGGPARK